MMKAMLTGMVVAMTPLSLPAQGLSAAAIIPTQALIQRAAAFPRLQAPAPIVAAPAPPTVSCDMPVASPTGPGAREGGVFMPPNHAVAIPVARSACTNRLASRAPGVDNAQNP